VNADTTLYGELAIADFLLQERNKTLSQADVASGKAAQRFGRGDLNFDHWTYVLNNNLREIVHVY
jgi:hypothetical protein